jgi:glycine hydroxymethyltransferase
VLCQKELSEYVDKACPAVMGGPLPHVIAAKAVAFKEANSPEFRSYAQQVVDNARALAEGFMMEGMSVLSGGTDNHIVLVDVADSCGLTGRQAEDALRSAGLTLNRNALPFDANGPWYTSGLRLGTPATTTLGMQPEQMLDIARIASTVIKAVRPGTLKSGKPSRAKYDLPETTRQAAQTAVNDLLGRFPLYPQLDPSIMGSDLAS